MVSLRQLLERHRFPGLVTDEDLTLGDLPQACLRERSCGQIPRENEWNTSPVAASAVAVKRGWARPSGIRPDPVPGASASNWYSFWREARRAKGR